MKSTTIWSSFHTEFASMYYNDKGDVFIFIFGEYIKSYMREIDTIVFIKEWKLNLNTSEYKKKLDSYERILSERKDIDNQNSIELFPKSIIEDMQWYNFWGIMLHIADKIKSTAENL